MFRGRGRGRSYGRRRSFRSFRGRRGSPRRGRRRVVRVSPRRRKIGYRM